MKVGVVTVAYITKKEHYTLALEAYKSMVFKGELLKILVINKLNKEFVNLKTFNDIVIVNDENCLASAWNKGIELAINSGCEYVIVPNLDTVFYPECFNRLIDGSVNNPNNVMWFATISNEGYAGDSHPNDFSCFVVHKSFFETCGRFNERFKPAYFEDSEMKARIKHKGYGTKRIDNAFYLHFQGSTVKNDSDIGTTVNEAWAINQEIYNEIVSNY